MEELGPGPVRVYRRGSLPTASSMSATRNDAASSAKSSAIALPMPFAAPVTIAISFFTLL